MRCLWATDLRTNEPVSAPFTIYDNEGAPVISAQTDAQGLWQGEFSPQDESWPDLHSCFERARAGRFRGSAIFLEHGVSPWDFGISLRPRAPEPKAYLYTDRPIYRPGQTVYFRGAVRQAFNGRYTLPEFASVPLELHDVNGRVIQTFELPLSPYGTFHGEYQLSDEAQPGYYSFSSEDCALISLSLWPNIASRRSS